jgi:hypothetical protein
MHPHPVLKWLEENNHSQKWLAERVGISEGALSKMLAGHTVCRTAMLLKIEDVTKVGPSECMHWHEKHAHAKQVKPAKGAV